MYTTNSTNSTQSALQAKSHVDLQTDLFSEEVGEHSSDHLLINQVFDHYHEALKSKKSTIKLLTTRKIDQGFIDAFNIGFSDRSLGAALGSTKTLVGSMKRGHLQRLALLKNTGHETFRGSMIFPYPNESGQIVGAHGRRVHQQNPSPVYHTFWNADQVSFFNATEQHLPDTLTLCKSATDTLTLLSAGYVDVVGTMGIKGFNDIQLNRLLADGVFRVYIAFDNTPIGNRYALLVAQALSSINIECLRIKLPLGHDVNRLAMSRDDFSTVFRRLKDQATPLEQNLQALTAGKHHPWHTSLETIDDCVVFYLNEKLQAGKSAKTINHCRHQLSRFQEYCYDNGVCSITDLSSMTLAAYQQHVSTEKNVFTGDLISTSTQRERIAVVTHMLARMHYYGVIPNPVSLSESSEVSHCTLN